MEEPTRDVIPASQLDSDDQQYQSESIDPLAQEQGQAPRAGEGPGRVALVTGGTSGLGLACAMELARCGWSLFLQHNNDSDGAAACQAVCDAAAAMGQVQVIAGAADLRVAEDREQLVEQVLGSFDRIDMLVNAAVSAPPGGEDLLELTPASCQGILDASLLSVLFLTQRVASEMVRLVESGQIENPKIVTLSSISAYTSSPDSAAQCIAQAATAMVTALFADRLGEHGINVYEVRAGILASPADAAHAKYDSLIAQGLTPIRRWGRPGDVARVVAAIAQDLLGFSTGEVINVDGGFHLRRL